MYRRDSDDDVTRYLAYCILALFAIPVLGVYWALCGNTGNKKAIGIIIVLIWLILSFCK